MRLNQRGLYKNTMRDVGRVKLNEGELVEGRDEKKAAVWLRCVCGGRGRIGMMRVQGCACCCCMREARPSNGKETWLGGKGNRVCRSAWQRATASVGCW